MTTWRNRHLRYVLLLLPGLAVLPSYLRAFRPSTSSEAPSICIGDTVIVNRAAYALQLPYSNVTLIRIGSPKRGDMVQLIRPDRAMLTFKRVIGMPGETIELKENRVFINGRQLRFLPLKGTDFNWVAAINQMGSLIGNEDGHWISFTPGKSPYGSNPPIYLAPRQYFLIGDNRDNSLDSRTWGPVPENQILGKVIVTIRHK